MKTIKILFLALLPFFFVACSEEKMDEINKEVNNTEVMPATNMLPNVELRTAVETVGTDIAWYATVYIEHDAVTWAQSFDADQRKGQESASLFNNSWNNIYSVMLSCNDILKKTDPTTGSEPDNFWARGITQVLLAYNLAVTTDMWGDVPYTEALKGTANMKPKFDSQQSLYTAINALLDDAIVNLGKTTVKFPTYDYIYAGDQAKWIKAANSLKARYALRLVNVDNAAATKALAAIPLGFSSAADAMIFSKFEASATGENPWYQFKVDRSHLSVSTTLYNYMNERSDPRIANYFTKVGTAYVPAPSGTAQQTQGGVYSIAAITATAATGRTAPVPLMTYHELKFIEAEAKFRAGDATWQAALQAAVTAAFTYSGATIGTYFADQVVPRLTAGNELNEILMQKYIATYEFEANEAYNDYRRTGVPTMKNPNNATTGFVHRFPYALSEVSSNPENVPVIDVYKDKVWWAK
jgi:hypothetical protein